jgi:hypothetical protein
MQLFYKHPVQYVIFFLVALFWVNDLKAGTQVASIIPGIVSTNPSRNLNLSLSYDVTEVSKKTTGLGLRIFFNSNAFESFKFEDILGEGLIALDEKMTDDETDMDNDAATDKYLGIAWVGVAGDWPSLLEVPIILAKIHARVREGTGIRSTAINVGTSSTPVGYTTQCNGAVIIFP